MKQMPSRFGLDIAIHLIWFYLLCAFDGVQLIENQFDSAEDDDGAANDV